MSLLIKNIAHIATMDDASTELRDGWIVLDGREITAVGTGPVPEPGAGEQREQLDACGALAIPGMVNTHHHLYQCFQRVVPMVQDCKLFDWLTTLYEIWRELTPFEVRLSAEVALGELLLSGCTTVADHFYVFPQGQSPHLLDETITSARKLGVRFHPSRGSMSRGKSQGGLPPDDVVQTPSEILKDSQRVIETYHDQSRYSMCRVALAPCSPFSVTDDLLLESARLARTYQGVRLHTHLAETKDEDDFCMQLHNCRPLEYMRKLEWIGPDVWYAHGVYLNEQELRIMAENSTGIAHCPVSNLRLGSGIAPIPMALQLGVPVGLAVDGSASNDASDMVRELQVCTMVHRVDSGVDAMPARRALHIATRGGAKVLGRDDIGIIAPKMAADIALFPLDDIGLAGALHDPVAALAMTTGVRRARWVFVNGKMVVKEGHLTNTDETDLRKRATVASQQMIERAAKRTGLAFFTHATKSD